MRVLTVILLTTALYAVVIGLWDHSWQLILAGVVVAVIWPAIMPDVEDVQTTRERDNP